MPLGNEISILAILSTHQHWCWMPKNIFTIAFQKNQNHRLP